MAPAASPLAPVRAMATPPTLNQLQPYSEERRSDTTTFAQPHASSFSPFHLLPSPLIAHAASHLDVVTLLRLQCCSSPQYRLRTNDVYMSVAWR